MKNSTIKTKYLYNSLGIIFVLAIWFIGVGVIDNKLIMPRFSIVLKTIVNILTNSNTFGIIISSVIRLILAITIGMLIGGILAIFSGLNKKIYYFISPLIKIIRSTPIASIIVICLIIFGLVKTPVIITLLMIIPLVFEAVYQGIDSLDKELIDVARLDTSDKFTLVKYAYLPLIRNYIKLAFFQSAGLGIKVLVMAEYISQTNKAIGNEIYLAKINIEYSRVYAWTIILIVIIIAIEKIIKTTLKSLMEN